MSEFFIPDPDDRDARYLLELEHLVVGVFRVGVGLKSDREILEIREGGRQFAISRLGPYAAGHFRLEAGETDDPALFHWFQKSANADYLATCRRTGLVIYMDGAGATRARWRFKNAQVTEWAGPTELPAPGSSFTIHRIGVSHEGLEPITTRV
jgi:phage tail-like protein